MRSTDHGTSFAQSTHKRSLDHSLNSSHNIYNGPRDGTPSPNQENANHPLQVNLAELIHGDDALLRMGIMHGHVCTIQDLMGPVIKKPSRLNPDDELIQVLE